MRSTNKNTFAAALIALTLAACSSHSTQSASSGSLCQTQAFFSRDAGPALVKALDGAQQSIHVAMYGLTSRSIVDALIAAKRRGVDVAIKTDRTETEGKTQASQIAKLQAAGVSVEVSTQQRHLHHKFAVVDGQRVITGSFNWTENAERRNRENLVILECEEMAKAFEREWASIRQNAP